MVQGIPRQGGRRRRQQATPQPAGQQEQPTPVDTRNLYEKFWRGAKIVGVLFVFWIILNIVSCTMGVFNWGRDKAKQMTEKTEKLSDDFDKKIAEISSSRKTKREEDTKKKIAIEERKKADEAIYLKARRLLSRSYAQARGWKSLNLELKEVSDTERSLTFPIIPYKGTHLPPIDLALAPAGTLLIVEDQEYLFGGVYGRDLFSVYQGEPLHTRAARPIRVVADCSDTMTFLLKGSFQDGSKQLASTCSLMIKYPSKDVTKEDKNTRIVLEKVFLSDSDFDQPVKVMDLPTAVDGVSVYWDLVVHCYPAWTPDPKTGMGRWMPSPGLPSEYLDLLPPGLHIKQTEDPAEPVIWSDDEGLLSDGSFKTSSEEMIKMVQEWRSTHGYSDVDWKGGNQLHVVVRNFPDRTASEIRPIGVTVRVILKVRTWERG